MERSEPEMPAPTPPAAAPQEAPLHVPHAVYLHPWAVRFTHWLNPVAPSAYRALTPKVLARLEQTPEPAKTPL